MGNLYVIATPIGNLNDISNRALELLKSVSLLCCEDTRQTAKLLNHYGIKQKTTSYHKFNEKTKKNIIIQKLLEGEDVALVTDAGTPCIQDPGYELVKEAREHNINIYAVPGPSATVSALSVSGLDTKMFSFIGFLSQDNKERKKELDIIDNSTIKTYIIYESPKRIIKTTEELKNKFPSSLLFIASDLTKIHERSFYGEINDVYNKIKDDSKIEKGEYVLILQKKDIEKKEIKIDYSIESLLVDIMVKEKKTLKEAVSTLSKKNDNLKKNEIYDASLNLKKLIASK